MATVADSIQYTLEQRIAPTIAEALWELDPVYPMFARSSMGVRKNRDIGRNWTVLKTWVTGVAGGAKFDDVGGSNVVSGPQNFTVYDAPGTFQSLDETTAPAFIQTNTQLIQHRGNFFLPHEILRADQLTSSIGSVVAQNMKGVSDLLAQQEAAVFYSSAPTTKALGAIGDTSATVTDVSADTTAININLGGTNAVARIHRFRQGMLVDLYNAAGTVKRNTNFFIGVDNVDPLAKTIRLRRLDGGTFQTTTTLGGGVTYAGAGGDLDIIVIKDSMGKGPSGLESWIADGSAITSFYGIDVRNFGQYKSYVPSAISAALTESLLNRHVGFFYESFPGKKLDTGLTTMGVLLGFIDNLDGYVSGSNSQDGRYRYDRQGQAVEVEAGWESFKYRFASRPLDIYTSTYAASGTFYAGKMKNGAITRYVPPPIPGAKVDSRFGQEVEFIGSLGGVGYQGIFLHALASNGAVSDFVQAPFVRRWQTMPEQPNFLKLGTITEITGF